MTGFVLVAILGRANANAKLDGTAKIAHANALFLHTVKVVMVFAIVKITDSVRRLMELAYVLRDSRELIAVKLVRRAVLEKTVLKDATVSTVFYWE